MTFNKNDAVKYYEGIIPKHLEQEEFFQDKKAYNTLNSLLFPTLTSEKARLKEGRTINPTLLKDFKLLISYYLTLLSAFHNGQDEVITYRVERLSDYQVIKENGYSVSFLSTSIAGFLKAYQDKIDLVLMCFHLDKNSLVVNMQEDLDIYDKSSEEEIIVMPFQKLKIVERALTKEEGQIKDYNGKSPVVVCDVYIENLIDLKDESIDNLNLVRETYQKLLKPEELTGLEETKVINEKKKFIAYLFNRFKEEK